MADPISSEPKLNPKPAWGKYVLRALVSLALLIAVFQFVDMSILVARIAGLDPLWLAIALLAQGVQRAEWID